MIPLLDDAQIAKAKAACQSTLSLTFKGLTLHILADDAVLLDYLSDYYAALACHAPPPSSAQHATLRVFLVNQLPETHGIDWTPVKRNKISPLGLKEAYWDCPQGRWIHKTRTGITLLQSLTDPVAIGELTQHRSQVVNFINNQFLNQQQRCGYLLGHASAFERQGAVTAIAASSGGGKSTLMLKALENESARFLSNDRILFQPGSGQVEVLGVAKHPRVNPGTLLNSPRLVNLLPAEERRHFDGMSKRQLWDIEQKYDVLIDNAYGKNKTALSGSLSHLILLDWSLDSTVPTALSPVDIEQTPKALEGLRKGPGPFFQQEDGHFPDEHTPDCQHYAKYLRGVQVMRLTGIIDFARAMELLQREGIL
ncbi:HprK-related kinase B [Halomonas sp. LS-001]